MNEYVEYRTIADRRAAVERAKAAITTASDALNVHLAAFQPGDDTGPGNVLADHLNDVMASYRAVLLEQWRVTGEGEQ